MTNVMQVKLAIIVGCQALAATAQSIAQKCHTMSPWTPGSRQCSKHAAAQNGGHAGRRLRAASDEVTAFNGSGWHLTP